MACETRIMHNNFIRSDSILSTSGSELNFAASNVTNANRQIVWIPDATTSNIVFDLGESADGQFFSMIGPLDETFGLTDSATITLQANSVNNFTSPPFEQVIPFDEKGAFKFFDGIDTAYRYWKVNIVDTFNPANTNIRIGHIYIGPYFSITGKTIAAGFNYKRTDRSIVTEAVGASVFSNIRNSYRSLSGLRLELVDTTSKNNLDQIAMDVGVHSFFYISIDSDESISEAISDLTMYAKFTDDPETDHIRGNLWDVGFSVREV